MFLHANFWSGCLGRCLGVGLSDDGAVHLGLREGGSRRLFGSNCPLFASSQTSYLLIFPSTSSSCKHPV